MFSLCVHYLLLHCKQFEGEEISFHTFIMMMCQIQHQLYKCRGCGLTSETTKLHDHTIHVLRQMRNMGWLDFYYVDDDIEIRYYGMRRRPDVELSHYHGIMQH